MAGDESAITQIQPLLVSIAPRVLLVDDDEIVVERLRELIAAAGFEVMTASNGAEALAGSKPMRLNKNGSVDPASVPNITTPTKLTPMVVATKA